MHKLDKKVEELLQHHGVKGMKWGIRRTEEQIAASESGGGGGGDEEDESLLEEMGDTIKDALKALNKKMGDVSKTLKDKGRSLLKNVLGEGKPTYKPAKSNDDLTKQLRTAMKKSEKRGLTKSEKDAVAKAHRDNKARGERAKNSNSSVDAVLDKYKKQGYKKHEKDKRTLKERGYKFKTEKWDGK